MREFGELIWPDVLARLHPLILHLPIGLFVALAWLEFWGWFKKSTPDKRRGQGALVWLLVICTPLTAATGWFLHEEGGYGEIVEWHERGGIALAFIALLAGIGFWRRSALYPWMIWLGLLVLVPTGHLGATLTHGEDFLLEPWLKEEQPSSEAPATDPANEPQGDGEASAGEETPGAEPVPLEFADVLPIFEARCTKCHGEKKQRGGLALNTLESVLSGGEMDGPAVVFGDPDSSPLLTHILLPLEHDDHMPPESKPQPSEAEVAWLRAWIAGEPAPGSAPLLLKDAPASDAPEVEESSPAAGEGLDSGQAAEAIDALKRGMAHVQPLSVGDDSLWIELSASSMDREDLRARLMTLAPVIAELSFAGFDATAVDLELCGDLPRLVRLDLRRLQIPEGAPLDLAPLTRSKSLRVLNLAGTPLPADALQVVAGLESLERVFLWGTGLEERTGELEAARPSLEVVGDTAAPNEALEVEPEVAFGQDGTAGEGVSDAIVDAKNSACPVTGQPVDPRFTVLHEGRAIGFCCLNCPKTFWQDPEAFLPKLDGE
jgi:uncharacterized membrane protein